MPTGRRLLPPAALVASCVLALALASGVPAAYASAAASAGVLSNGLPTALASSPAPRPQTPDGPVPANLRPTLGAAPRDYPRPYFDGCHTVAGAKPSTGGCYYGDLTSMLTIALFGDSHALSWFPAVEHLAKVHGWRLLSLTMSACSPADIGNWVPAQKRISTECTNWRKQAISRLVKERPALILVAGTRGFELADSSGTVLSGDTRTRAWEAGMRRTLARLVPAAGRVITIADTPLSRVDPPVCLSQHPKSVLACATPVAAAIDQAWLGEEQRAAGQAGAGFIDPSLWVCPSTPCPVVVGNVLIYRNPGHLTATFAATLYRRLDQAILAQP